MFIKADTTQYILTYNVKYVEQIGQVEHPGSYGTLDIPLSKSTVERLAIAAMVKPLS